MRRWKQLFLSFLGMCVRKYYYDPRLLRLCVYFIPRLELGSYWFPFCSGPEFDSFYFLRCVWSCDTISSIGRNGSCSAFFLQLPLVNNAKHWFIVKYMLLLLLGIPSLYRHCFQCLQKPKSPPSDLPTYSFRTAKDLESFLDREHTTTPGFHLKLAKKASGIKSVSAVEAVETALCFGWIDGRAERRASRPRRM